MIGSRGWVSGILRGRSLQIPVGAPVRIKSVLNDKGQVVVDLDKGVYMGTVVGTEYARIRMNKFDPRFTNQNISGNSATLELAIPLSRVYRRRPWPFAPKVPYRRRTP